MEKKEEEISVRGRSRAKEMVKTDGSKKKKNILLATGAAAAVVVCAGCAYLGLAQRYKTVYFPNTQINGVDASGLTVEEVKEQIAKETRAYVLELEERGGKTEQITGESIDLHPEFDGTLEALLAAQNPYEWGFYQFGMRSDVHSLETMVLYEESQLEAVIDALSCLLPEEQTEPENAKISAYESGIGYHIVPETEGTVILKEALYQAVSEHIQNLQEKLSLEEAGIYKEPELRSDSEALLQTLDTINLYVGTTITYRFGDKTEVLNGDRIWEWLSVNADGTVALSSSRVASYIEELAAKYNTSNKAKTLKTSYGTTIQVKGGSYGWRINQSAEAEELAGLIRAGKSQTREPVYGQKAASHGEQDYGTTYVEINLTAQHLFLYKEGKLVVESDFVSGNLSKGWGTPAGTYALSYKQKNAVLKGETYRTPVDYWMPFNGGIGMHDATWRSSFGGTIYKTNGSHGCINLPHSVAKTIYETISAGTPVICYNLAGTERTTSSTTKKPETTAAAETKAPETKAPETAETKTPETEAAQPTEPSVKPGTGDISIIETPAQTQPQETQPQETKPQQTEAPPETSAQTPGGPASDQGGQSGGGSGPALGR